MKLTINLVMNIQKMMVMEGIIGIMIGIGMMIGIRMMIGMMTGIGMMMVVEEEVSEF